MKKIVLGISGGVSFLIFLILMFVSGHIAGSQPEQNAADRWSSKGDAAQVSCFFSANMRMTEDRLISFEHTLDGALKDAGVVAESENPGARLWTDAYSADGTLSVSSDRARLNNVDAIGIGGDFFLFHPLKLLSGAYFSGNDIDKNYCVIDRDAAWQLFGSNNVAGKIVFIGDQPHIVTGVVERPEGRLAKAAGLDSTLIYVSYETLSKLGSANSINHYEIVMPNPVSKFAFDYVKKNLGSSETETEVIENTSRFSLLSRLKLIETFGTRSMNGRAIIYPYWENIARGYEDILLVLTVFELIFLLYPTALVLVLFVIWWRHKGWTVRDVYLKVKDKAERLVEKLRAMRQNRKAKRAGARKKGEKAPAVDTGMKAAKRDRSKKMEDEYSKAVKKAEKRRKKEIKQELKQAEKERKKSRKGNGK